MIRLIKIFRQFPTLGISRLSVSSISAGAASQCYQYELMLLKCQINTNTKKKGIFVSYKMFRKGIEILILSFKYFKLSFLKIMLERQQKVYFPPSKHLSTLRKIRFNYILEGSIQYFVLSLQLFWACSWKWSKMSIEYKIQITTKLKCY